MTGKISYPSLLLEMETLVEEADQGFFQTCACVCLPPTLVVVTYAVLIPRATTAYA